MPEKKEVVHRGDHRAEEHSAKRRHDTDEERKDAEDGKRDGAGFVKLLGGRDFCRRGRSSQVGHDTSGGLNWAPPRTFSPVRSRLRDARIIAALVDGPAGAIEGPGPKG